jgi:hypothetical protein
MRYVIIKVKCYKKMAKPEGEDDVTGNDSNSWDKVPQVNNCTAYEKTKYPITPFNFILSL